VRCPECLTLLCQEGRPLVTFGEVDGSSLTVHTNIIECSNCDVIVKSSRKFVMLPPEGGRRVYSTEG
jgi:hypothetical protein